MVAIQQLRFGLQILELPIIRSEVPGEDDYILAESIWSHWQPSASLYAVNSVAVPLTRNADNSEMVPPRIKAHPDYIMQVFTHPGLPEIDPSKFNTWQANGLHIASPAIPSPNRKINALEAALLARDKGPSQFMTPITYEADADFAKAVHYNPHIPETELDQMNRLRQEALDQKQEKKVEGKFGKGLTKNLDSIGLTIPRLFVILPEMTTVTENGSTVTVDNSSGSTLTTPATTTTTTTTISPTNYRVHFICECGEHSKAVATKLSHHLHLDRHPGYKIKNPQEFYLKFGAFIKTGLQTLSSGTASYRGIPVPALSTTNVTPETLARVDQAIRFMTEFQITHSSNPELVEAPEAAASSGLSAYLNNQSEDLKGLDLSRLGSYLEKDRTGEFFGNLYRMLTKSSGLGGQVRWVCREHFRDDHLDYMNEKLSKFLIGRGRFEERLNKLTVTLESSASAVQFYAALGKAKGLMELDLKLAWNHGCNDYVNLKGMVLKTNLVKLSLNLFGYNGTLIDFNLAAKRRYDPLLEMIQFSNLKSLEFKWIPSNFFQRSGPFQICSSIRHLGLHWYRYNTDPKAVAKLKTIFAACPNLSTLYLESDREDDVIEIFKSLEDVQTSVELQFYEWLKIPGTNKRAKTMAKMNAKPVKDLTTLIRAFADPDEILGDDRTKWIVPREETCPIAYNFATTVNSEKKKCELKEMYILDNLAYTYTGYNALSLVASRSKLITLEVKLQDDSLTDLFERMQIREMQFLKIDNTMIEPTFPLRVLLNRFEAERSQVFLQSAEIRSIRLHYEAMPTMADLIGELRTPRLMIQLDASLNEWSVVTDLIQMERLKYLSIDCCRSSPRTNKDPELGDLIVEIIIKKQTGLLDMLIIKSDGKISESVHVKAKAAGIKLVEEKNY